MIGTLDTAAIEALLESEVVGRIGCHADGQTYVVPVSYVYDGDAVYGHTSEGRKIEMMRSNPQVCFEIDRVSGAMEWDSVVADARFEELAADEAQHTFGLLVNASCRSWRAKRRPAVSCPAPSWISRQRRPVVFRLRLGERTGRFQRR